MYLFLIIILFLSSSLFSFIPNKLINEITGSDTYNSNADSLTGTSVEYLHHNYYSTSDLKFSGVSYRYKLSTSVSDNIILKLVHNYDRTTFRKKGGRDTVNFDLQDTTWSAGVFYKNGAKELHAALMNGGVKAGFNLNNYFQFAAGRQVSHFYLPFYIGHQTLINEGYSSIAGSSEFDQDVSFIEAGFGLQNFFLTVKRETKRNHPNYKSKLPETDTTNYWLSDSSSGKKYTVTLANNEWWGKPEIIFDTDRDSHTTLGRRIYSDGDYKRFHTAEWKYEFDKLGMYFENGLSDNWKINWGLLTVYYNLSMNGASEKFSLLKYNSLFDPGLEIIIGSSFLKKYNTGAADFSFRQQRLEITHYLNYKTIEFVVSHPFSYNSFSVRYVVNSREDGFLSSEIVDTDRFNGQMKILMITPQVHAQFDLYSFKLSLGVSQVLPIVLNPGGDFNNAEDEATDTSKTGIINSGFNINLGIGYLF